MNKYIAIEGIDGCGKTTILRELRLIFDSDDKVIFVKSPLEPFAALVEKVWDFPLLDRFIFFAASNLYFSNTANNQKVYVLDRFIYSTFVTHLYPGKNKQHEDLLTKIIEGMTLLPQTTFLLEVSKDEIYRRLKERNSLIDNALDIDALYEKYYASQIPKLGNIIRLTNESQSDLIKNICIIQAEINRLKNI